MQPNNLTKWLIISHGFNMDGRAASLTVTDKIPYLLKEGIQPIVLSAITGEKDQRFLHYQLLPWGPAGLRFDFRHFIATKYGRGWMYKVLTPLVSGLLLPFTTLEKMIIGLSSQASWSYAAAYRGIRLIKKGQVDLIYSSGGAWSAHYAAWLIKRATGKLWIAEIHDPMVIRNNPQDDGTSPRATKDKRFLQKLEGLICKDADHIWWFTQGALDYATLRHPASGQKGFVVFPGAIPPGSELPNPVEHLYQTKLHIAHFGSLADDRSIAPVIMALSKLISKYPEARNFIQLDVYGAGLDHQTKLALTKYQLEDSLVAYGRIENDLASGQSGRARIMDIMRLADVLLMLHGDYEWCAEYIPSKSYDYYWTHRPIWAITNRNQQLDSIMEGRGNYISHTLDQNSNVATLERIWLDWQAQNLKTPLFEPMSPKDAVDQILARVLAHESN